MNLSDMFGCTALMYASKSEESKMILQLLLERKDLDLDGKDNDGKTAETYAEENDNDDAVKLIREERLRRMGRDWSAAEDVYRSEEFLSTSDDYDEDCSNDSNNDHEDADDEEKDNIEDLQVDDEALESELVESIQKRLSRAKELQKKDKDEYEVKLKDLRNEKETKEEELKKQIETLERKYQEDKSVVEQEFESKLSKSNSLISKLENAIANIDLQRILSPPSSPQSCSDLECPICLEEMKPPMKIWQWCGIVRLVTNIKNLQFQCLRTSGV